MNQQIATYGDSVYFVRGDAKVNKVDGGQIPIIGAGAKPIGYTDSPNAPAGTITISNKGTVGKVYLWQTPIFANECCYRVYPNADILPEFLLNCLQKDEYKLTQMHNNEAIKNLDINKVKALPFYVPDFSVQASIVVQLEMMKAEEALTHQRLEQLSEQHKHTLNEIFKCWNTTTEKQPSN